MRILHTADWHLGKLVNEFSMLDDQIYMLDQLIQLMKDEKIDVLLMAGDIYDRAVPPKEAVTALDNFLTQVKQELDIPILMIAGNHDGGERLDFATGLLAASDVYIEATFKPKTKRVELGNVHIYLVPFADHIKIRHELGMEEDIKNIEDATQVQVEAITQSPNFDPQAFNILTLHGYVINQSTDSIDESDSERPLSIGTAEYVDAKLFDSFDYVALGHLHKPQKVGRDSIRYSGSLLKYSKSEVNHQKSVMILDIDENRDDVLQLEKIDLKPRRDMRALTGEFDDLITGESDDYVFFELTDQTYISDAMNKLRRKYPNAMGLEYVNLQRKENLQTDHRARDMQSLAVDELFQQFYETYREQKLDDKRLAIVQDVLAQVQKEDD